MTRHRGRSRVYASALMPITVRGRVAVATRTRSRLIVSGVSNDRIAWPAVPHGSGCSVALADEASHAWWPEEDSCLIRPRT
jgi:hypothetical protein